MRYIALACGILWAACMTARDSSRSPSSDTVAASTSQTDETRSSSVPTRTSVPSPEGPAGGRLGVLRDSLAQFPNGPRVPNWLWEIGTASHLFAVVVGDSGPAADFARQHPDEFDWSQSDAAYF